MSFSKFLNSREKCQTGIILGDGGSNMYWLHQFFKVQWFVSNENNVATASYPLHAPHQKHLV